MAAPYALPKIRDAIYVRLKISVRPRFNFLDFKNILRRKTKKRRFCNKKWLSYWYLLIYLNMVLICG
jgi:hypothetical protein